ncbi:MAG: O-antigen ligase family protein [Solirubrobacteraceae bacterium]|nr:O-antigen ligase family protein [Solirubrobacteraceae bacterium]
MATPEPAQRFLEAPQRRVSTLRARIRLSWRRMKASELRFVPWVVLTALLVAPGVAIENWQYVGLLVSVIGAAALYVRWPTAGLVVLVLLWTITPLVRRLLDYYAGYTSGPDVLSLAPFFATLLVGAIAFRAQPPSKAVLIVLGAFGAGLLYAIPLGVDDPFALLFALFSYPAAAVGLLIGYRDWKRQQMTLEKVLIVLIPLIAAYGIYQYLTKQLPPWDALWLKTDAPVSTGRKETGDFRAFSVLNSPGLLAGVLALFGLMLLVAPRLTPWKIVAGALTMGALAFTQVRSAWLAMGIAMIALIPLSRGNILLRVLPLVCVLGAMYVTVGGSTAGQAVVDRATSVKKGEDDGSVKSRIDAITEFAPKAIVAPLGNGLGSVGQAARVSLKGEPPFVDNGYLTILWQGGLLGFLLMMGSIVYGTLYGVRNLNKYKRRERFPFLAVIIVSAVMHLSGDALFGLPAVILWYSLGALMASSEDPKSEELTIRRKMTRKAAPPPRPAVGGGMELAPPPRGGGRDSVVA